MKKLLIMAALLASAVMANAATVNWTASNVYQPGTTTAAAQLLFCFDSSQYEYSKAQAAIATGKTDFLANAINPAGAKTTSAGKLSASGVGTVTDGSAMTGYMVILNAETIDAATKMVITAEMTGTASGATGTPGKMAFGSLAALTSTAANWQTVAVPEPTSGLLMLLGIAGLALKRRRA